jgi:hypothetical protein
MLKTSPTTGTFLKKLTRTGKKSLKAIKITQEGRRVPEKIDKTKEFDYHPKEGILE